MRKLYILVGLLALGACNKVPEDNSMEAEARATVDRMQAEDHGVSVWTDEGTKCQYLVTNAGGIVLRKGSFCPESGGDVEVSTTENDSEGTSE